MSGVVKRERHTFPVPLEVRQYMTGNVEEITWSFINPTDALVRMLVLSPLAGLLHEYYCVRKVCTPSRRLTSITIHNV